MNRPASKTTLLIFGISGDLAMRKLLPALDEILRSGEFDDLSIVGISRRDIELPGSVSDAVRGRTTLFKMDMTRADDYARLKNEVLHDGNMVIAYLSVPPLAVGQIVRMMGDAGLTTPNVKVMLEKPFGIDHISSTEMNDLLDKYFDEEQVYRIDHYLAKEMAQNIVMFRRGNALFARLWNNQAIESIEIIAAEKIGIEGRGEFYEQTGALRDVLQGHVMQLLALALMDIPDDFEWKDMPGLRLKSLEALRPADPQEAIRAQYVGYQDEAGNVGSQTETFVAATLYSDDPRWHGVPLRVMTGKALDRKATEIHIYFRKSHEAQTNCLTFNIHPDEGVSIVLNIKKPGYTRELEEHTLSFSYPENTRLPDAYEQVIVDSIRSDRSLFPSGEETVESWRVLQPLLDAWSMDERMPQYDPGSSAEMIMDSLHRP